MTENESVLLCLELYGNVTVNKKLLRAEGRGAEDYLRERVTFYNSMDYRIPDTNILVMRFPDRAALPDKSGFDGYRFIEKCKKMWPELQDRLGVSVPFEGKLQSAAYCFQSGKEPTFSNMMKLHFTPEFKEFRTQQQTDVGPFKETFLERVPDHQRPDDWSFVFGMTNRIFTYEERADILALGCILSCGMEKYLYTPARFNAFDRMGASTSFIREVIEGEVMPQADFKAESRKLKEKAAEILTELYPQVADVIKDLSGTPTGSTVEEVYGLINGPGAANFVNDNYNPVTNNNPQLGFAEFMDFYCNSKLLNDRPDISQYRFVRLRGDGLSYKSVEVPTDGDYWLHWNLFLDKAKKLGIDPMNEISYLDASYCIANGRSPLHPANIHGNLVMEKEYAKFVQQMGNHVESRKQKPVTQKADTEPLAGRRILKSQPKKKGPSL